MRLLLILLLIYVCICVLLYFIQERLIFFPEKLPKNARFTFEQEFEEVNITTRDNVLLNGVLFKADNSKGLLFYLHGNAGSIASWGDIAGVYTALHYDVFIPDFRGYGKSEGKITSEQQLHDDVKLVYNHLKSRYSDSDIVILGYSLGTAPAAKLAAENDAKLLILQAPYYSLTNIMKEHYRIIPTFILKYKLETNKYLRNCRMPVVIFHGDQDELIDFRNSVKLKELLKPTDTLIRLKGVGHNGMSHDPQYLESIKKILDAL